MNFLNNEEVRSVLKPLNKEHDVVLFGSAVEGGMRSTSDIDIAVLSRCQNNEKNVYDNCIYNNFVYYCRAAGRRC